MEKKTNFRKKSHNAEKLKGGPFGVFQHPFYRKTAKKIEGGTLRGKNFSEKKVSQCREKTERGDRLVSPDMVCYAEKQEKPFLVQFARPNGAI